jgi:UDP-glucose 4-epimerase
LQIFGQDYQTIDGTCVRDYIHVEDLAQAHFLAMQRLLTGGGNDCYNLGNGLGFSVKQVIDVACEVTGLQIPHRYAPRRPGDPAALVGASERAKAELGWTPKFTELKRIIETAWDWYQQHPHGY